MSTMANGPLFTPTVSITNEAPPQTDEVYRLARVV
jgi:hypothetical protein